MPRHGQRAVAILSLAWSSCRPGACDKIKAKQAVKKGNEFFKAGKYDTALASYQEAERLDPGELKLKKNIGLAYMGMYQPGSKHAKDLEFATKAIENLKVYVAEYPDDRRAQEFLVSMYLATDRYDEAIGFYENMLKQQPERWPRPWARSRRCTSRRATSTREWSGRRKWRIWRATSPIRTS